MNIPIDNLKNNIEKLIVIVNDLEKAFPGKRFTLDGHLLGSIGEVFASYYYGIDLYLNDNSHPCHDGEKDGKEVQIKITQGNSVDINNIPDYLIVLFLKKDECEVYEVFNGPGKTAIGTAKRTKNGWYTRTLNSLDNANKEITDEDRIQPVKMIHKGKST
jgi:hypothetical protein